MYLSSFIKCMLTVKRIILLSTYAYFERLIFGVRQSSTKTVKIGPFPLYGSGYRNVCSTKMFGLFVIVELRSLAKWKLGSLHNTWKLNWYSSCTYSIFGNDFILIICQQLVSQYFTKTNNHFCNCKQWVYYTIKWCFYIAFRSTSYCFSMTERMQYSC